MTAEEYYNLGNEFRAKGDYRQALNNYMEAI
ncbi:MAG: tetratricopeptide repeat protein, partial [Prevotella sp.]|nr:tetratricopeptide repeat protein [Prevotella sp.]